MSIHNHLIVIFCWLALFVSTSIGVQEEPEKVPALQEAQTLNDVYDYIRYEFEKIDPETDEKERAVVLADIFMAAHEKAVEVAKTDWEKNRAYDLKFTAFRRLIAAEIEEAEQKVETFLKELSSQEEFRSFVEQCRFQLFADHAMKTVDTPGDFDTFKAELITWINRKIHIYEIARTGFVIASKCEISLEQFAAELTEYLQSTECTLLTREKREAVEVVKAHSNEFQFYQFVKKAEDVDTPERFDAFKTELKAWIDRGFDPVYVAQAGLVVAQKNEFPAKQFIQELVEYVQSPECSLSTVGKKQAADALEKTLRTAVGSDLELYGKTLDDQDFDWESLRGKYVLVKFTATWCGPCKGEIPGMLDAYEKYHDKGLEIVSVYIWEQNDPVATVKKHVEKEKLPWMIISEALTVRESETAEKTALGSVLEALTRKPKPQKQGEFYAIKGVPTMLLVDQEGKIILTEARGGTLKTKLVEIFDTVAQEL